MVEATETGVGCSASRCGDQRTVQLHPHLGRRCSSHITVPPGPFRSDFAADMVEMGRADASFAYLDAWLTREIRDRFAGAIRALEPLTVGRLTDGTLTMDIVLGSRAVTW